MKKTFVVLAAILCLNANGAGIDDQALFKLIDRRADFYPVMCLVNLDSEGIRGLAHQQQLKFEKCQANDTLVLLVPDKLRIIGNHGEIYRVCDITRPVIETAYRDSNAILCTYQGYVAKEVVAAFASKK